MSNSFLLGGMPVNLGELAYLDYSHEKIHESEMYMAHYYGGTVAGAGSIMLHITTGTVPPHLIFDIEVGGDARMLVTEGGTVTGGTAVTIRNMNRNNSGTCLATIQHSGTLTGGTVIQEKFIAGGTGPQAAGGGTRANNEIIALKSKVTTITLINITTAYPASLGIVFYEEEE